MSLLHSQLERQTIGKYSNFAVVEKALAEIVDYFLQNERLKKLLYYTDSKALGLPPLNQDQTYSLIGKQIKIVPQLEVDFDAKPYIIVSCDRFDPIPGQTSFRTVQLSVSIICPFKFWTLENFKLRPYAIAGEVDIMLNKSNFNKLGIANFVGANSMVLNESLGGLNLVYEISTLGDDITSYPDNA